MIGRAARLFPKNLATVIQVRDTPRQGSRWQIIFLIFVTSMAVYGTYLSALRAAFVGLMLVGGGLLVINAWFVCLPAGRQVRSSMLKNLFTGKRISVSTKNQALSTKGLNNTYKHKSPASGVLSTLLIITILSTLLIFLVPKPDIINFRFDNMTAIDDLQFKGDPAIHSRLDSWELSWEMIKEYPLLGTGLGGFKGYNNIEWTKVIKYPHNIILEMTAEGGVIGLLILILLIYIILLRVWKIYPGIILFFLFALWLAMFSKEFSNQSLLWIGLVFYGMGREASGIQRTEIKMEE